MALSPRLLCILLPTIASAATMAQDDAIGEPSEGDLLQTDSLAPGEGDTWNLWEREQLTGDWFGARTWLGDAGITFDPYVIIDGSRNVQGGLEVGNAFRHLLSVNMRLDLPTLIGWDSGTVFVDFHNQAGDNGSDLVGDYQYVGNYDADGLTQVSELWFEYEFLEGMLRLKAGKVDANWEFAFTEFGWEFVFGSASYPATIWVLPTYPDPATSVNLFYAPSDAVQLGVGVYDGALLDGYRTGSLGPATFFGSPSDLFLIAEGDFAWHLGEDRLPGRIGVGGWHHTGDFERFDGRVDSGTGGFFLVFDQMLWREEPSEEEGGFYEQGVGFYLQYDYADENTMCVDHHVGAGLTWRGLLSQRDDDLIGIGASWVHFSDDEDAGFVDDGETAIEAFYKLQLTPAASVQPYLQYISNPGGSGLDDAVNVGLRSTIRF